MKKILALIILLSATIAAHSQTRLYDDMCDPLQSVFCDFVSRVSSQNVVVGDGGRYVGTIIDGQIYGWGIISANDGTFSVGQFRNGKTLFGISMNDEIAKVGGEKRFVIYDLESGSISRLHSEEEGDIALEYPLVNEGDKASPYSFRKVIYENGDSYVGEFYNGKRHGYGIYYWANGEMWYGRYIGGYRNGFGVLIRPDRHIFYGKWVGDSKVE